MTTLGFKTGISPRIAAIVTEILDLMISFPLLYRDEKQGSGHAMPRLTRVMSVGLLIEPRSEQAGYRNGIRVEGSVYSVEEGGPLCPVAGYPGGCSEFGRMSVG